MKILRISLAIILLVYSIPALLSGLDIYHGKEPDLSSEWIIILIFFTLVVVFLLVNFLELFKVNE